MIVVGAHINAFAAEGKLEELDAFCLGRATCSCECRDDSWDDTTDIV